MTRHNLHITLDDSDARRILGKLAKKLNEKGKLEEAIRMALNEGIDASATEAVRAVREEYSAPYAEVRNTMRIWYASRRNLQARLMGRGKMVSELMHYKAIDTRVKQKTGEYKSRGQGRGVSVKVLKSSARTLIKAGGKADILETRRGKPRVWIAKGHVLAMTGKGKDPIRMLWGPSFLSRLSDQDIRNRVLLKGKTKFEKRLKGIARHLLG